MSDISFCRFIPRTSSLAAPPLSSLLSSSLSSPLSSIHLQVSPAFHSVAPFPMHLHQLQHVPCSCHHLSLTIHFRPITLPIDQHRTFLSCTLPHQLHHPHHRHRCCRGHPSFSIHLLQQFLVASFPHQPRFNTAHHLIMHASALTVAIIASPLSLSMMCGSFCPVTFPSSSTIQPQQCIFHFAVTQVRVEMRVLWCCGAFCTGKGS